MNKINLAYLILLLPFFSYSINKVSPTDHKNEKLHPDIIVKHIKNDTNYPIRVVLRSEHAKQDLDTFETIQPHSKQNVKIDLEYNDQYNNYEQLGFRWLKSDAAKEIKDSKPTITYTPSGTPKELNITLAEDPNKVDSLKIIKSIHLHKKKHKKHRKHRHHHHHHKHKHAHKDKTSDVSTKTSSEIHKFYYKSPKKHETFINGYI